MTEPKAPKPKAPLRLGKYQVLEAAPATAPYERWIAKAELMKVQQLVQVKRVHPEHTAKREHGALLLEEARIAALMGHPALPRLIDFGNGDGGYFIAYEHVLGYDARTLIGTALHQAGRVPLPVALHIVSQLAAALHYVHERCGLDDKPLSLVHGGVSTDSVFITHDGNVKLLELAAGKPNTLGSGYQSPEQCEGRPIDRRSDVFSLGVVLFEMTVGRRLFFGNQDAEIRRKLLDDALPRPTAIDGQYPADLERVLLRALARDPAARYASAEDFQVELEAFARRAQLATSSATVRAFMHHLFRERATEPGDKTPAPLATRQTSNPKQAALKVSSEIPVFEIGADLVVSDLAAPPPPPRRAPARR